MLFYTAAVLVIIYISYKLFPLLIRLVQGGVTVGAILLSCIDEKKIDEEIEEERAFKKKILDSYTNYKDFKNNFPDFLKLSRKAKRYIKNVFSKSLNR